MGAAYTLGKKRHLAIDLMAMKLEHLPVQQAVLHLIINCVSLFFAAVIMIYGGGSLMLKTLATGQVSPALGIQMGYVYAAIPLNGLFMLVYLIQDIISNVSTINQPVKGSANIEGEA
jgi:TRAP-type C4-dicarboxylate transport system permease small subunit